MARKTPTPPSMADDLREAAAVVRSEAGSAWILKSKARHRKLSTLARRLCLYAAQASDNRPIAAKR